MSFWVFLTPCFVEWEFISYCAISRPLPTSTVLHTEDIKFVHESKPVPVAFEINISGYKHSQVKTVALLIESRSILAALFMFVLRRINPVGT